MPGNEVGERVHNFFGQENLSQVYQSQVTDVNWPVLNNNLWSGNQRQINAPFSSSLKNFTAELPDAERGHTSQSSHLPHGLDLRHLAQLNQRPESGRSQTQYPHPALNGYMQGHPVLQTRQNEANFFHADSVSNRSNLTPRPLLEAEGNGHELYRKNLARLDGSMPPVNFDCSGAQQQITGRHSGVLQGLPGQHSGINDMQLLQQQLVLTQMQELYRHQQLQSLEARQQNSVNHATSITKPAVVNQSTSLINGIPINEASNVMWAPEVMTGNVNWLQSSASPAVQGSSGGLVVSTEQGQAMHMMGLVPQQVDQSLYGLPVSSSRGTSNEYSHFQVEKGAVQRSAERQYSQVQLNSSASVQVPRSTNSFPVQQYPAFSGQANTRDGSSTSGQDIQGRSVFRPSEQGLNNGLSLENLSHVNSVERKGPLQEFNRREQLVGSSEALHEKPVMQIPPKTVATLDPTEEKILFGSDDNMWEAFGSNSSFAIQDSAECLNGIPSLQSGSWSALMQSAVAETSGNDVGLREEWSSLTFQNVEQPFSIGIESGEQQPIWAENNSNMSSNSKSRPPVQHEEPKMLDSSTRHCGFQHSRFSSRDHHDKFQTDSSHCSALPFHDRDKWIGSSPQQNLIADGNNIYGSVANSSTLENRGKNNSGSWNPQQTPISCSSSGELSTRQNNWNLVESVSADTNTGLKNIDEKPHQRIDHHRSMQELGHIFGTLRPSSSMRPSTSTQQVFKGDSSVTAQNSASRVNPEGIQRFSNSHSVETWRDVDSSGSSRKNEGPGNYRHHMENNPQVLESSLNNSLDRGGCERHEMENSSRRDSSIEGNVSNSPHYTGSGLGETSRFIGGDSQNMLGFDSKSSGQVSRRSVGSRRFQYHPMGDLEVDVEHYHGKKLMTHSQPFPQSISRDQRYVGQFGPTNGNLIETEKVEVKSSDEAGPNCLHPSHLPKNSSPFDRSFSDHVPIKTTCSQNMLELLPKVDQVRAHGIETHISPNCDPSPRMSEAETYEEPIMHTQKNQGFGLQLGPPAQRFPVQEHAAASCNSPQTVVNFHSKDATWLTAIKPAAPQGEVMNSTSGSSGQIGEKSFQYNVQGNFPQTLPSGFPFSRIHSENQSVADFRGQVGNSLCVNKSSFDKSAPNQLVRSAEAAHVNQFAAASTQDTSPSPPQKNFSSYVELSRLGFGDQINARESLQQSRAAELVPASQPDITANLSEQVASPKVYNVWTSVPNKQNASNAPSFAVKKFETVSGLQRSSSQDIQNEGKSAPGFDAHTSPSQSSGSREYSAKESSEQQLLPENVDVHEKTMGASHWKEPIAELASDAYHLSTANRHGIEAFVRSLRPINILHQNYMPLQQDQITRGTGTDPSNRSNKRFKGLDGGMESQQLPSSSCQQASYVHDSTPKDAVNDSGIPADDMKMLRFSSGPGNTQDADVSSKVMTAFGLKNSSSLYSGNNATSAPEDNSRISPEMAPSFFDQHGMLKNGKMLSLYDVRRMAPPKLVEQPLVGKDSDNLRLRDSVEIVNTGTTARQAPTSVSVSNENMPSLLLPPDTTDRNLEVMKPKKRKSLTSELVPWHRELVQGSERLQNISEAEIDWARFSNRLIEKVEVEGEPIEDLPPLLKSKRRIILTTQLMQQILRSPLSVVPSDVKLHFESVAYSVARLTLGDACRAISCFGNETVTSPINTDLNSSEAKRSSKKIGNEYLLRVVEDFLGRAKKLENDTLRADSRASIVDIIVECQDLERFSVINRFAKFHGRGQAEGAEASSSSDPTGNIQRTCLQKYVNAVPMPKNLPDRVKPLVDTQQYICSPSPGKKKDVI